MEFLLSIHQDLGQFFSRIFVINLMAILISLLFITLFAFRLNLVESFSRKLRKALSETLIISMFTLGNGILLYYLISSARYLVTLMITSTDYQFLYSFIAPGVITLALVIAFTLYKKTQPAERREQNVSGLANACSVALWIHAGAFSATLFGTMLYQTSYVAFIFVVCISIILFAGMIPLIMQLTYTRQAPR